MQQDYHLYLILVEQELCSFHNNYQKLHQLKHDHLNKKNEYIYKKEDKNYLPIIHNSEVDKLLEK